MTTTDKAITPQAALVLDYLSSQPGRRLTPLIAHTTLGVASLTARIAELRSRGYNIADSWEADHFQRRYKAYWMVVVEAAHGDAP